jgi:hypothetical protein
MNKKTADSAFSARELLGTHKISERGAYWFKRNTPLFPVPAAAALISDLSLS